MAIEANKLAFEWGRRAAHDLAGVEALIAGGDPRPEPPATVEALIERRVRPSERGLRPGTRATAIGRWSTGSARPSADSGSETS